MASYKVPQDVEADDKFVGPLSFKQFLFAGGAVICGYLMFILITKSLIYIAVIFLPPFLFFVALAFPWSKDQPTELWLASRIRFLLVPHKRIWSQDGIKDLVEITVPKREVHLYTDGLDKNQIENRLSALASVVDSRGWAVKNLQGTTSEISTQQDDSDRLVSAIQIDLNADDPFATNVIDVLDEHTSPISQQFDSMIQQSTDKHRQETIDMVNQAQHQVPVKQNADNKKKSTPEDFWFLHQSEQPNDPSLTRPQSNIKVSPGGVDSQLENMGKKIKTKSTEDESKFLQQVHKKQAQEKILKKQSHIKTIQPLGEEQQDDKSILANQNGNATSITPVDPAIMTLPYNDDLDVATIARQANKTDLGDDEVVISLH